MILETWHESCKWISARSTGTLGAASRTGPGAQLKNNLSGEIPDRRTGIRGHSKNDPTE